MLAPWLDAITILDIILKSRDITLPTRVHQAKALVFPVVMYGCESWTIKTAEESAESQCNSNYDRLLFVTNKVLKSGRMTISDKTNLKQLYSSWKDLGGRDAKMDTLYEECIKITPTQDDAM